MHSTMWAWALNAGIITETVGRGNEREESAGRHSLRSGSRAICHGNPANGGSGAANLNLTEGKAYDNLVDVPSTRKEGRFRVVSGTASQSLLHQILAEGGEDILHYNHTEVLSSQFKNDVGPVRTFIDYWINSLQ